jgi:hypothetical protein
MPAEEEHDEIRVVIQTMREIRNAIILGADRRSQHRPPCRRVARAR